MSSQEIVEENGVLSDKYSHEKPNYVELHQKVSKIVKESSWWEVRGEDNLIIWSFMATVPLGFWLLASPSWLPFLGGVLVMGSVHGMITAKAAHLSAHGCLTRNQTLGRWLCRFFVELCAAFTVEGGLDIHLQNHHPHTNIIGRGDSSIWRAPYLPGPIYMFVAPVVLPVLAPFVAIASLWGNWSVLLWCVPVMFTGIAINYAILMYYCGLSASVALLTMYACRGIFTIPYVHINIFQHIGLFFYSQENRPRKLEQMATGCLNLDWNPILSYCFGHSLISCHVEHHLFPRLSDRMCLKIKPVVSSYIKTRNLPYFEDSYWNRLKLFVKKYEELMVDPPAITSFVGIQ